MKNKIFVLDTNVLVSATRSALGASFFLMQQVRSEQVQIACTPALFLEYESVLKRAEHLRVSGLSIADMDAILAELASLIHPAPVHYRWRPQLRDPNDEMVLEAAVNAHASAIVTHNVRDFKPAPLWGLAVWTPKELCTQLRPISATTSPNKKEK